MSDLLLALDVGNTRTKLGVFEGETLRAARSVEHGDLSALPQRLDEAWRALDAPLAACAAASVNPAAWERVQEWAARALGGPALRVRVDLPVAMPLRIDQPETLGDDRLMNAVAAYARARGAAIVVDFGTAATFEVVSDAGEFLGGAIAPGLRLAAEALSRGAAQLPLTDIETPPAPLGRCTVEAIQAGCFFGLVGLAKEILARLQRGLGGRARVFATGGAAALLAPHVPAIDEIVPSLTLEGVALTCRAARPST